MQLTHKHDVGYELTTQLLVDTRNGRPVAPVPMHMKIADGYLSTAEVAPGSEHRLEQVLPLMREADSVFHLRQWSASGFKFLVRVDGDRIVRWRGEHGQCLKIKAQLESGGAFRRSRDVTISDAGRVAFGLVRIPLDVRLFDSY